MRYHLDEHVADAIANGLRLRGIDVTTTADAGLRSAEDIQHLAFALAAQRVILTRDDDFLTLAARGVEHAGIIYCQQGSRTIGQIVHFLLLLDGCLTAEEMHGHVEFVPIA